MELVRQCGILRLEQGRDRASCARGRSGRGIDEDRPQRRPRLGVAEKQRQRHRTRTDLGSRVGRQSGEDRRPFRGHRHLPPAPQPLLDPGQERRAQRQSRRRRPSSSHQDRQRLGRADRPDPPRHEFPDQRDRRGSGQPGRPPRIHRRQRLRGIPVHQGQIRVPLVLTVSDQAGRRSPIASPGGSRCAADAR